MSNKPVSLIAEADAISATTPPLKGRKPVVKADEAQQRILSAVDELFYQEGARAVSVDAVVKRAGLNKMTVYRQFEGKDALISCFLARHGQRFWGYINGSVAKQVAPGLQLLQIFQDLAERVIRPAYRGCPFVNIAVEFPERSSFARTFVATNKADVFSRFLALATAAEASNPTRLATTLCLLLDGVYAASQTYEKGHLVLQGIVASVEQVLRSEQVL